MAVKIITAYKDGWLKGDAIPIRVPLWDTPTVAPTTGWILDLNSYSDLKESSLGFLDDDPTFIATFSDRGSVNTLTQLGFPYVIEAGVYYISESNFFEVSSVDRNIYFYSGDSFLFYGNLTDFALTLPVYTESNIKPIVLGFYYTSSTKGRGIFSAISHTLQSWYADITPYDEDLDPYSPGGASGTGGGTGTFSGTGDSIDFPGLPTLSAVSTGFITLFNPSIAQMQSLANYMWSDLFDLDTFKKIFADPMDCILGLSIVPVAVPNGGTVEVKVGNISTGISMTVASTQYVEVDCGTLNVQEYWGSYLDYDPYTKAEIYLPYCGTHPIAVDDIMGKSVHVKYHVDILSGACVAYVKCGSSVLYSFIGQCTSSIPITGNDWTNVVNGAISIASAIGSMVATGGATAPLVMPGVASTAVNSLKPSVEKSGSMSGTGGMLAVQTPYLILTRPRQALPKNQNTYTGYPSFIQEKLSDLKGYTEVADIRLSGVDATDAELDEIVGLLKGGVII